MGRISCLQTQPIPCLMEERHFYCSANLIALCGVSSKGRNSFHVSFATLFFLMLALNFAHKGYEIVIINHSVMKLSEFLRLAY